MYNFNDLLDHFASKPEIRAKIEANRKAHIQNLGYDVPMRERKTLSDLLADAFMWHETPEGRTYWQNIYISLEKPVNIEE